MSEINVTPMVDVMLVLLIIFMVAAPMLTSTVPIDLPDSAGKPTTTDTQPLEISVNQNGEIHLQNTLIAEEEIVSKLEEIAKTNHEARIFIRGDKQSDYGTVMKVISAISASGYKNIGLVGLPLQQ